MQGPIITGLSKTDKVTCLPYDGYRNNFFRCITKNQGLLVAGYSFSDYYINQMFYRMFQAHGDKSRVVLIDSWDLQRFYSEEEADDESDVLEEKDLHPRIIEKFFTLNYGNDEMLMFIKRVTHRDMDVWEHFDRLLLTGLMVSDNGSLMLFIGGFKNAIDKHGGEIMRSLRG